jgi:hypothetical protein
MALKTWKESTSTSPSGRHLGHYKCLLLDLKEPNDETTTETLDDNVPESRATSILKVYWNMIRATAQLGISLARWQVSHTSMIQKTPGINCIDKLRAIHIYEADYNLYLKIFWGRKLVHNSNDNDGLNKGPYGSRPGRRCVDQVIKKVMVYEYSAITRTAMATMDNDAKSCFDRIICALAMLISFSTG